MVVWLTAALILGESPWAMGLSQALPIVVACLGGAAAAAMLMRARAPVKKQRLMFRTAIRKDKLELYKRHHRSGVTR